MEGKSGLWDGNLLISELSKNYKAGSLLPSSVVEEIHHRIESTKEKHPNVFIHLVPKEAALARAKELEARKTEALPLYGIPFVAKDNIDVAGIPTTAGCKEYAYVPEKSSRVVQQLLDAGAILIGKSNLDQFATGLVGVRSPYGACSSVFGDGKYISGGSSSGSAVSVAAGWASFSLGTDTAGSGRVPAGFNNIVGLKPTKGRISLSGVVPACYSLDCVSIFALSCEDALHVLKYAQGTDKQEEDTGRGKEPVEPYDLGSHGNVPFRFGVPEQKYLKFFDNAEAERLYGEAIKRLESMGGHKVEIDYSALNDTATLLYGGPWVAERTAAIESFIKEKPEALYPTTRTIIEGGFKYSAVDTFRAFYKLEAFRNIVAPLWKKMDFLVLPTSGTIYTIAEVQENPIQLNTNLGYYTNFANLLDLSAVAVPNGFQSNGLPAGVTFFAPALQEGLICSFGAKYHASLNLQLGGTAHKLPLLVSDKHEEGSESRGIVFSAEPYAWPYDKNLSPSNTAIIVIDMQIDFVGQGGYVDHMGYDLSMVRAPIVPIKNVLTAARESGYTIIHTREGHRPDQSDLPANKKWRSKQIGAEIGCEGGCGKILTRGEKGWDIIPELAPLEGESIIDKPGKGSFWATDLEMILRLRNIRNLVLMGVTTDVCVHTTMREANDRGFECLLLQDCTGATNYGNYLSALKMIKMQGGVFGAVSTSEAFINAIKKN